MFRYIIAVCDRIFGYEPPPKPKRIIILSPPVTPVSTPTRTVLVNGKQVPIDSTREPTQR